MTCVHEHVCAHACVGLLAHVYTHRGHRLMSCVSPAFHVVCWGRVSYWPWHWSATSAKLANQGVPLPPPPQSWDLRHGLPAQLCIWSRLRSSCLFVERFPIRAPWMGLSKAEPRSPTISCLDWIWEVNCLYPQRKRMERQLITSLWLFFRGLPVLIKKIIKTILILFS